MHIYLKHPNGGTKVAIAEAEAKQDERLGWQRFDPVSPSPNPIAVQLAEPPKRGRPRKVA
jgi:hypothetical protein